MNQQKLKTKFDPAQIAATKSYLIKTGRDFEVRITNYTTQIISKTEDIKFIVEERGPGAFIGGKKIAADVSKHPTPDVNLESLYYYLHRIKGSHNFDEVIAIDIKSAYPTALLNAGYISTATFNFLQTLPKKDRLVATGLIASRKDVFSYRSGKLVSHTEETNPQAPFFFYAVRTIGELMTELKEIAGYNFLFSWVDCIYIGKGDMALEQVEQIKELLEAKNYRYTVKTLLNVSIIEEKHNFKARYFDPERGREIPFIIPKQNSNYKRALISLLSKDRET